MAGVKIGLNADEAKRALKDLRTALEKTGRETEDVERETQRLERRYLKRLGADKSKRATDELTRSLKLTQREMLALHIRSGEFGKALSVIGGKMRSVAKVAFSLKTAMAGLVVGFTLRKALNEFQQFETALVDMGKVTDQSFGEIKEQIDKLDPALGNATELVRGYYQVISAGVTDPVKAMDTLITVSKTAKAAHLDQAQVVRGITSLMDAYAGQLRGTAEAADFLFQVEALGKTQVSEIIPLIGTMAAMAANLGVSLDELGASFAQVTQFAGSSAEASTQVEAVMRALIKPTTQLEKLLSKYGGTQKAIAQLGFVGVLKEIWSATEGNVEALGNMISRAEAISGVLALAKNDFRGVEDRLEGFEQKTGKAERAWKQFEGTLEGIRDAFENTVANIFRDFGEELAPDFKRGLEDISNWLAANKDVLIAGFRGIAEAVRAIGTAYNFVKEVFTSEQIELPTSAVGILEQKLKDAKDELENFKSSMKDIGLTTGMSAKQIGDALAEREKKVEVITKMLEKARENLARVTQEEKKATEQIGDWEEAVRRIGAVTEQDVSPSFNTVESQLEKIKLLAAGIADEVREWEWGEVESLSAGLETFSEEERKWYKERAKAESDYWDKRYSEQEEAKRKEQGLWAEMAEQLPSTMDDATQEMEETYRTFLENVQSETADVFYDMFSGTLKTFEDFADRMKDYFFRVLAEMAARAVAKPIVIPVVSSIAGTLGFPQVAKAGMGELTQYAGLGKGVTGLLGGLFSGGAGTATIGSLQAVAGGPAAYQAALGGANFTAAGLAGGTTAAGAGLMAKGGWAASLGKLSSLWPVAAFIAASAIHRHNIIHRKRIGAAYQLTPGEENLFDIDFLSRPGGGAFGINKLFTEKGGPAEKATLEAIQATLQPYQSLYATLDERAREFIASELGTITAKTYASGQRKHLEKRFEKSMINMVESLERDLDSAFLNLGKSWGFSTMEGMVAGIEAEREVLGNAFRTAFETGSWLQFKQSIAEQIYNAIGEGLQAEMIQSALMPVIGGVSGAFEQATAGGGFDVGIFQKYSTEAISLLPTILSDLRGSFNEVAELGATIRKMLVGTFQSGGIVPKTGLAMVHEGETVMPAGAPVAITLENRGVITTGNVEEWLNEVLENMNNSRYGRPLARTDLQTAGIDVS